MKKVQLMIIADGSSTTKHYSIPKFLISVMSIALLVCSALLTYFFSDYWNLLSVRGDLKRISLENEGLKGEARLLSSNLDEVKRSLERVHNYSSKLQEITNIQYKNISSRTGIGPLTDIEYQKHIEQESAAPSSSYIPFGVDYQKLTFRPIFDQIYQIETSANYNFTKLKKLLATLSERKSLLSSIPSVSPVNGWVTSSYGSRVSPFTGEKVAHRGIDLASPIGTPIRAPADGVVIFSGPKDGFGNFIMIAHGNGVVSRYGHNAQNMVQPGQKIVRGEQIATVGMTGNTTGPHLHYEVIVNGTYVNPKKFMLNL